MIDFCAYGVDTLASIPLPCPGGGAQAEKPIRRFPGRIRQSDPSPPCHRRRPGLLGFAHNDPAGVSERASGLGGQPHDRLADDSRLQPGDPVGDHGLRRGGLVVRFAADDGAGGGYWSPSFRYSALFFGLTGHMGRNHDEIQLGGCVRPHLIICQMETRMGNRRKSNFSVLQKCYGFCCFPLLNPAKYRGNRGI